MIGGVIQYEYKAIAGRRVSESTCGRGRGISNRASRLLSSPEAAPADSQTHLSYAAQPA